MKKILIFAVVLGVAASLQAQHVTPLDSLSTQINIDTMRAQYRGDAVGMLAALKLVQVSLDRDAITLKNAGNQLKDEMAFAKSLSDFLKNTQSELNAVKGNFETNMKNLNKLDELVNKQLSALRQVKWNDGNYMPSAEEQLRAYQQAIHDAMDKAQESMRNIDGQIVDITNQQTAATNFQSEIDAKKVQLQNLQNQYKATKDAVKNEVKLWKAQPR